MIRKLKYDEKVVINHGTRHSTLLRIADSILLQHSDDIDISTLKDFFILVNEHCCKPNPLPEQERNQIWNDATAYVAGIKAAEASRILSVSEAVREKAGSNKTVRGTVISISAIFKAVVKTGYRCLNCHTINEGRGNRTKVNIYFNDESTAPKKCVNCSEKYLELDGESSIINEAKIITLQNTDLRADLDETLEVLLLDEYTKDVRAGETLLITGSIYYGQSNLGRQSKSRKIIALMTAKFVTYEDDLDEMGEGFRRSVLMILRIYFSNANVIMIDEPDASMHSKLIKDFIIYLRSTSKQVLIATHNEIFVNEFGNENLRFVHSKSAVYSIVEESTSFDKNQIFSELGLNIAYKRSLLLSSQLILLVEGENDRKYINWLIQKAGYGPELSKYRIDYEPTGGNKIPDIGIIDKINNSQMPIILVRDRDENQEAKIR